jgi:undecaprenyl-diphosphatase
MVDRSFVLAVAAALLAMSFFLFFADPVVIAATKTLPVWIFDIFRPITRLGYGGYWLWPTGILILILLAVQRLRLDRLARATSAALFARVSLLFWAVAVPGLISALAKGLIGRTRPRLLHPESTLDFDPLAWRAAHESFPSGHATVAFAAAVVLGAIMPRFRLPFFALAVLAGLSRIILRVHYPSDAIAGGLVGVVFASLVVRAFAARRLSLAVALDGTIKPKPMPGMARLVALAASILATLRGRNPARPVVDGGEI